MPRSATYCCTAPRHGKQLHARKPPCRCAALRECRFPFAGLSLARWNHDACQKRREAPDRPAPQRRPRSCRRRGADRRTAPGVRRRRPRAAAALGGSFFAARNLFPETAIRRRVLSPSTSHSPSTWSSAGSPLAIRAALVGLALQVRRFVDRLLEQPGLYGNSVRRKFVLALPDSLRLDEFARFLSIEGDRRAQLRRGNVGLSGPTWPPLES